MPPPLSYDRYGLTGNPFRDLISETQEDVEAFHVNLDVDGPLERIKEEVLDKENRAVVAIVGAIGAGKTERLRVADSEARRRKARSIYVNTPPLAIGAWKDIADTMVRATEMGGFSRIFNSPKWMRGLAPLQGGAKKPVDAKTAARAVAEALNEQAPAFLLLNDLHNLHPEAEIDRFATFLQELTDACKPGVLVMFGCYANFYLTLSSRHPALQSRISRTITLPTLTDEQAALLIAKKLLAKRIVESLDPLFPFDSEAVEILNKAAFGNPRRLLEFSDLALEQAVMGRNYRIDGEVALAAVEARRKSEIQSPKPPGSAPPAAPVAAPPAPKKPVAAPAPAPVSVPSAGKSAASRPEYLED